MSKHSDLELKMLKTKKLEDLKQMTHIEPITSKEGSEEDSMEHSYGDEENIGLCHKKKKKILEERIQENHQIKKNQNLKHKWISSFK